MVTNGFEGLAYETFDAGAHGHQSEQTFEHSAAQAAARAFSTRRSHLPGSAASQSVSLGPAVGLVADSVLQVPPLSLHSDGTSPAQPASAVTAASNSAPYAPYAEPAAGFTPAAAQPLTVPQVQPAHPEQSAPTQPWQRAQPGPYTPATSVAPVAQPTAGYQSGQQPWSPQPSSYQPSAVAPAQFSAQGPTQPQGFPGQQAYSPTGIGFQPTQQSTQQSAQPQSQPTQAQQQWQPQGQSQPQWQGQPQPQPQSQTQPQWQPQPLAAGQDAGGYNPTIPNSYAPAVPTQAGAQEVARESTSAGVNATPAGAPAAAAVAPAVAASLAADPQDATPANADSASTQLKKKRKRKQKQDRSQNKGHRGGARVPKARHTPVWSEKDPRDLKALRARERRLTILWWILAVLAVFFAWASFGLMMRIGFLPTFDLGYSWFDSHITFFFGITGSH
ncbi:hypothetical protein KIM372_00840 [Bombiscardovia nodaiensis]|uniref:Uncharacterized protein n=1 Tax=Bombiscardovia nodaiensis TaxID=2932181 RepID=A0ABM8B5R2_9BIFI|nr:hypothetical protein KIM372_00840 [Bombiscardovia nodaiensis]